MLTFMSSKKWGFFFGIGDWASFDARNPHARQTSDGFTCIYYVLYILPLTPTHIPCIIFLHAVKFSIKSFKIPKLVIDVPEIATVGSLKVYVIVVNTGTTSFLFITLK